MFTLKVSFGKETRSIQFAKLPTYDILRVLLSNLFEGLQKDFLVQYYDDEGDNISVKSDLELQEAHRLIGSDATLQLNIKLPITENFQENGIPQRGVVVEDEEEHLPNNNVQVEARAGNEFEVLTKIEEEVLTIFSNLGKYIHDLNLQKQFNQALSKWDKSLGYASTVCKNTYDNLKTTVQNQTDTFTLEHQIAKLREKIFKLTLEMTTLVNQLPAPHPTTTSTTSSSPSPQMPISQLPNSMDDFEIINHSQEQLEGSNLYPSLSNMLPPDAATKDLQHLEQMGFLDKNRNLELLAKYKGDMAQVIEALLS